MRSFIKNRYSGYGNVVVDACIATFIILMFFKLLGANYGFITVVLPLIILATLYLLWYLVFTYCMWYQYGGSLFEDSKKCVKSKLKGFVK